MIAERLFLYVAGPSIILLTVLILWHWLGVLQFKNYVKPEDAAHYGDSFGNINALFSGLAFGGVIYAIILQMIELRYQRLELVANRRELKKTAEANTQLVRLNALTALSQFYFDEFGRHQAQFINEYEKALMFNPKSIALTKQYKLDNCVRLLESLYGEVTGEAMGQAVIPNIPLQRKKSWHMNFFWNWTNLDNYWNGYLKEPERQEFDFSAHKDQLTFRLKSFADYLEHPILRYVDCLDEDEDLYRDPINRAITAARSLIDVIERRTQHEESDWQAGHRILSDLDGLVEKSRAFNLP